MNGPERRIGGERRHSEEGYPSPDASRLTFPVQTVILVVSVAVSVVGSTWGMRSDLRDIQTRAELRQAAYEQDQKNDSESIKALKAQVELLRYDFNEMNLQLARDGVLVVKERGGK